MISENALSGIFSSTSQPISNDSKNTPPTPHQPSSKSDDSSHSSCPSPQSAPSASQSPQPHLSLSAISPPCPSIPSHPPSLPVTFLYMFRSGQEPYFHTQQSVSFPFSSDQKPTISVNLRSIGFGGLAG